MTDEEFIVPKEQKWGRYKKEYWFISERLEVVWRYWEGSTTDKRRKKEGNYFHDEAGANSLLYRVTHNQHYRVGIVAYVMGTHRKYMRSLRSLKKSLTK